VVGDVLVHNKQVCTEVCIVLVYQLAGPLFMYVLLGEGGLGSLDRAKWFAACQPWMGCGLGRMGPGLRGGMAGVSIRDSGIRKVNKVLGRLRMGRLECWRWSCGLHCRCRMGILYVCSVLSLLEYYGSFWCMQGLSYYGDVAWTVECR